ncbi:FAR1-related sequence 5-like protein [Tanacetum coccineum]
MREAMAAKCYTRNIYEIFKKEWKASGDCGHEKISKVYDLVKYRVGFIKGNKEHWKTVEYKVGSDFATCSCARFETCGILCKHILYIMKRKLLVSIPDHYILPRWTMKATYNGGSIRKRWSDVHGNATQQVSFMTLWSIRSKFNKLLEGVRDSPCEIEKLNTFFDDCLNKQHQRHSIGAEVNSVINSTMPVVTQSEQEIIASDPVNRVKTKGRPKAATRIKSGLEISMEAKKRKKRDEAKANNSFEVPAKCGTV